MQIETQQPMLHHNPDKGHCEHNINCSRPGLFPLPLVTYNLKIVNDLQGHRHCPLQRTHLPELYKAHSPLVQKRWNVQRERGVCPDFLEQAERQAVGVVATLARPWMREGTEREKVDPAFFLGVLQLYCPFVGQ